ncbi:MAG: hypothetical protein ACHQ51_00455 [Elusimicrobiota bacterium]
MGQARLDAMNTILRCSALGLALVLGASACATDPAVARARAQQAQDAALWRDTVNAGTAAAYVSFLKTAAAADPRTVQAREACRKLLLEGPAGPDEALAYLRLFPTDPDADRIRAALEKTRFAAARASSDPRDDALFAAQYPGTADAETLAETIRRDQFQRADAQGTRLAYQYFLKRYPAAPEAKIARERLAALVPPGVQAGDENDLALLPRLRRAAPQLVRFECRNDLTARLRREKNVFGADAENLRQLLARLAKADSVPEFCAGKEFRASATRSLFVAGAVRALAQLQQRRQALSGGFTDPDKLASDARDIGARAAALADDAESQDLELEAFYGSMPADPKRPDDTAAKNAREALRRAKRGYDLSRALGDKSKKASAAALLTAMDRQADLLLEIIAANERPVAAKPEPGDAE